MSGLPTELLLAIFGWVEDNSVLFNLRLVSKTFDAVATPFAFHVLTVKEEISSVEALVCLQNCGGAVVEAVKELIFKGSGKAMDYQAAGLVRKAVLAAFSRLRKFRNLASLRLELYSFPAESATIEDLFPLLFLQMELFSELAAHPPPTLVSLTLDNLIPFDTHTYVEETFQHIFRTLKTLRISVLSRVYTNVESNRLFWASSIPHMLRSARECLTSLTLLSDQPVGVGPIVHLAELHFPSLVSLRLRHFVLDPPVVADEHSDHDVLAFILRHGATLTRLALDECAVYGGSAGTAAYLRPWHVVLRRMEAELPALRSLELTADEHVGRVARPLGYLDLNAWDIYRRVGFEVGYEAEDAVALHNLMFVVESRRKDGIPEHL
ncbi:hypothetical protein C8F04DRAFT_100641 [Mycena alexandri]|uniref:F-box domain-containing protein n=1 Tax=Mycena alexandri TaxID=1745969 RepID=A0AAD6SFH0_9AGAR|nr:hypothetical protein C8F04DRAFT_100641 [Mycena alexandri]